MSADREKANRWAIPEVGCFRDLHKGHMAGQESRQAEIDALKEEIAALWEAVRELADLRYDITTILKTPKKLTDFQSAALGTSGGTTDPSAEP